MTGAVASQNVTEAREGSLRLFGNQPESAKAEALHRVKNVVRLLWPRALVLLYGSYVSGLSLPSSDIDVVINLPRDSQHGPLDEHNAVRTCVRSYSKVYSDTSE